jgi:hypothetical protein
MKKCDYFLWLCLMCLARDGRILRYEVLESLSVVEAIDRVHVQHPSRDSVREDAAQDILAMNQNRLPELHLATQAVQQGVHTLSAEIAKRDLVKSRM